jgi:hypothetical protein
MSTTPSPVPGLPPGQPREELLKALAKRFRGKKDKFMKPTDWSAKRDKEDDDDRDDGSTATVSRSEAYEEDVRAAVSKFESRPESAVMRLLRFAERDGKLRGMTIKEIAVPSPLGGHPFRMVTIDATQNMWQWFVGSMYFDGEWTIIKQDRGRTQAIQVQL